MPHHVLIAFGQVRSHTSEAKWPNNEKSSCTMGTLRRSDPWFVPATSFSPIVLRVFFLDLQFSPDGRYLAVACADGFLRVVDYAAELSVTFTHNFFWKPKRRHPLLQIGSFSPCSGRLSLPVNVLSWDKADTSCRVCLPPSEPNAPTHTRRPFSMK